MQLLLQLLAFVCFPARVVLAFFGVDLSRSFRSSPFDTFSWAPEFSSPKCWYADCWTSLDLQKYWEIQLSFFTVYFNHSPNSTKKLKSILPVVVVVGTPTIPVSDWDRDDVKAFTSELSLLSESVRKWSWNSDKWFHSSTHHCLADFHEHLRFLVEDVFSYGVSPVPVSLFASSSSAKHLIWLKQKKVKISNPLNKESS